PMTRPKKFRIDDPIEVATLIGPRGTFGVGRKPALSGSPRAEAKSASQEITEAANRRANHFCVTGGRPNAAAEWSKFQFRQASPDGMARPACISGPGIPEIRRSGNSIRNNNSVFPAGIVAHPPARWC
ncbi:MAG: hypothetical protein AB7V13_27035, partial [Pseudorhodoplanes sp.]